MGRCLTQANQPISYDLDYHQGKLVIDVTAEAQLDIQKHSGPEGHMIVNMAEFLGLQFGQDPAAWGFGGQFQVDPSPRYPGWTRYWVELPRLYQETPEEFYHQRGNEVCWTLDVLFSLLMIHEAQEHELNQLLTIDTIVAAKNNYGLAASLSPQFVDWLTAQATNANLDTIARGMRRAYSQLWPARTNQLYVRNFKAVVHQERWLRLESPGEACDLSVDDFDQLEGEGQRLTSHNTFSSLDVLTLLVGLAVANRLARHAT